MLLTNLEFLYKLMDSTWETSFLSNKINQNIILTSLWLIAANMKSIDVYF